MLAGMKTPYTALTVLGLLAIAAALHPVQAGDDHDRARRAVQAGQVLPLRTILDHAARDYPGEVIEAELDDDDGGRVIYELKLITDQGQVVKLYYDAQSGALLKVKGKRP